MNKPIVAGVAALAVVIAVAVLLKNNSPEPDAQPTAASKVQQPSNEIAAPAAQLPAAITGSAAATSGQTDAHPTPPDPRLAALAVSPPSDLIEFIRGPDGQVIKEIDKDPASPGFNNPSREYMYSHGKVTRLTAYRYSGDQLETTRTAVSYKPDGSVDELVEQTTYSDEKRQR